jgi:hypothetical protein
MEIENLNDNEFDGSNEENKKRNTCLLFCIILILVLMLPSSIALLAIF